MSTFNTYQLESTVLLATSFTLTDDVTPVAPTGVFVYVQTPDGVVTEYTDATTPAISNPSTGNYTIEIQTTQPGPWVYKWQGTGTIDITSPDQYFLVSQSAVLGANAC